MCPFLPLQFSHSIHDNMCHTGHTPMILQKNDSHRLVLVASIPQLAPTCIRGVAYPQCEEMSGPPKKHFSSAIPIENHPVALVQSRVYFIAASI